MIYVQSKILYQKHSAKRTFERFLLFRLVTVITLLKAKLANLVSPCFFGNEIHWTFKSLDN